MSTVNIKQWKWSIVLLQGSQLVDYTKNYFSIISSYLQLKYETLIIVYDFLIKIFAKDDLDTGMKPQRTLTTNQSKNNFRYASWLLHTQKRLL